jgi:hypothetical protein
MTQATLPFDPVSSPVRRHEPREIFTHCPSCQKKGWFVFRGVQRWSEPVAAACGLPAAMRLWTCESCLSTLTEANLRR